MSRWTYTTEKTHYVNINPEYKYAISMDFSGIVCICMDLMDLRVLLWIYLDCVFNTLPA